MSYCIAFMLKEFYLADFILDIGIVVDEIDNPVRAEYHDCSEAVEEIKEQLVLGDNPFSPAHGDHAYLCFPEGRMLSFLFSGEKRDRETRASLTPGGHILPQGTGRSS